MGALRDQLQADLAAAMKARDDVAVAALRMALAAVGVAAVAGRAAHEPSDEEVQAVLRREVRKCREAGAAFEGAGRAEQAERERAEARVIERYLPQPMSDEELLSLVRAVVAESGAQGPAAMGQVMRVVTPRVAGRAEGGRVAAVVRSELAG